MTTARQVAANRENSKRSTGPKTTHGKAVSRRNALSHGLSGEGIVLPDELEAQIPTQKAIWSQGSRGWDDRDLVMIEQAAVENLRVHDCQRQERELRIKQCYRADSHWDQDRHANAVALFVKLARNPLVNAVKLESTLQGCELMIERWEHLLSLLENDQPWNPRHRASCSTSSASPRRFATPA